MLDFWAADGTFQASVDAAPAGDNGGNEFVFYDGPPFANGLPHYGHLLTGYVKDVVPRYQTMRGRHVERRFGWDTHGLPAETEAEKQLGIKDKSEIDEMGVAAFNDACRSSVLRYTDEWRAYVTRQARWVDFDNDYKTLDLDYMESVMWAFKTLWDKGLVYQGFRVLWYCWRDEHAAVGHRDQDGRRLPGPAGPGGHGRPPPARVRSDLDGALALIWTTTPWTLPSNLAMAVQPGRRVRAGRGATAKRYVLAAARVGAYARELGEEPTVLRTLPRRRAARRCATPRRSTSSPAGANAHRVLAADYVTTEDGTGIVHIAPAFGEEDKVVTDAAGIEVVVPVDSRGEFDARGAALRGHAGVRRQPADHPRPEGPAGPHVQGVLLRHETYDHPYPHCWRCGNPLIQRAVDSWFVQVTAFRDRMVELNQQITWVPEHVKDGQFGKWLESARDWSISRNRYWGSPDPGVGVRRPGVPAHRRLRLARRAGARLRRAPDRPAPALTSTS